MWASTNINTNAIFISLSEVRAWVMPSSSPWDLILEYIYAGTRRSLQYCILLSLDLRKTIGIKNGFDEEHYLYLQEHQISVRVSRKNMMVRKRLLNSSKFILSASYRNTSSNTCRPIGSRILSYSIWDIEVPLQIHSCTKSNSKWPSATSDTSDVTYV